MTYNIKNILYMLYLRVLWKPQNGQPCIFSYKYIPLLSISLEYLILIPQYLFDILYGLTAAVELSIAEI